MRYLVVAEGARGAELAGILAQGGDVTVALSAARGREAARDAVDVLVLGEALGGRLTHDVALLAECRNPAVATILLSDRPADEAEELWELLPSLHAILGGATPARLVAEVARNAARTGPARPAEDERSDAEDEAAAVCRPDVQAQADPDPGATPATADATPAAGPSRWQGLAEMLRAASAGAGPVPTIRAPAQDAVPAAVPAWLAAGTGARRLHLA